MLSPQLLRNIVRTLGARKLLALLSGETKYNHNHSTNANNNNNKTTTTKKSTAKNAKSAGLLMDVVVPIENGGLVVSQLDRSRATLVENLNLLLRYVYSDLASKSAQHIKV